MDSRIEPRVENGWSIARVQSLLHADRRRPAIRPIQRRLVGGRATHVTVRSNSWVEEEQSPERDLLLDELGSGVAHGLWKRLKDLLRSLEHARILPATYPHSPPY